MIEQLSLMASDHESVSVNFTKPRRPFIHKTLNPKPKSLAASMRSCLADAVPIVERRWLPSAGGIPLGWVYYLLCIMS